MSELAKMVIFFVLGGMFGLSIAAVLVVNRENDIWSYLKDNFNRIMPPKDHDIFVNVHGAVFLSLKTLYSLAKEEELRNALSEMLKKIDERQKIIKMAENDENGENGEC